MADLQVGNTVGVAAVGGTGGKNINGGDNVQAGLDLDNTDTIAAMRARLNAINSTTYSAAQLNKMTYNDMVYAIRLNDAAGSIK